MALTYWGDPEKSPSSDVHSKLGFRSRAQRGMYRWWMGATRSNLCPCKGQSIAEAISASTRQANLGGPVSGKPIHSPGKPVLQYFLSRNCLCPQTDIMFASWTESRRRRGFNPLNTKRNEAWTQTCIITLGLRVSAIFPSDHAKECHVPRCSLRAAATTKVANLYRNGGAHTGTRYRCEHGNLQRGESGTAQPASLP